PRTLTRSTSTTSALSRWRQPAAWARKPACLMGETSRQPRRWVRNWPPPPRAKASTRRRSIGGTTATTGASRRSRTERAKADSSFDEDLQLARRRLANGIGNGHGARSGNTAGRAGRTGREDPALRGGGQGRAAVQLQRPGGRRR